MYCMLIYGKRGNKKKYNQLGIVYTVLYCTLLRKGGNIERMKRIEVIKIAVLLMLIIKKSLWHLSIRSCTVLSSIISHCPVSSQHCCSFSRCCHSCSISQHNRSSSSSDILTRTNGKCAHCHSKA